MKKTRERSTGKHASGIFRQPRRPCNANLRNAPDVDRET